ncbi:hypothetical protein GCM10022630_32560 [Thermobifida alba]
MDPGRRRGGREPTDRGLRRLTHRAVSPHPAKLRLAGLVESRKQSRHVIHRLRDGHLHRLVPEELNHVVTGEPFHDCPHIGRGTPLPRVRHRHTAADRGRHPPPRRPARASPLCPITTPRVRNHPEAALLPRVLPDRGPNGPTPQGGSRPRHPRPRRPGPGHRHRHAPTQAPRTSPAPTGSASQGTP